MDHSTLPDDISIDPKIDPAFKAVLGQKELLLSFLNDLFVHLSMSKVVDLEYENTELEGDGLDGKVSRLDLLAKVDDGYWVNLEMQVSNYFDMPNRLQFYASKLFARQFRKGTGYGDRQLRSTIVIALLNFHLIGLDKDEMVHRFRFYDDVRQALLPLNKIHIITVELPKLSKLKEQHGTKQGILSWFSFFRSSPEDQQVIDMYDATLKAKKILLQKKADNDFLQAYIEACAIVNDPDGMKCIEKVWKKGLHKEKKKENKKEERKEEKRP
jgi:predicted transposase/invertase (TIGR01784 family)